MAIEVLSTRESLVIRRQTLAPGEATAWHRDPCERFSVVVRGQRLRIEYQDGTSEEFAVAPGEAGWNEPEARVHRAVNVGAEPFEEVVTFHRSHSDEDVQPTASA